MPTINCFNEKKVKFGQPNKCYNLLADSFIQINAHINNDDDIDELGIILQKNYIKCCDRFYLNKKPIYRRRHITILQDYLGFIEPQFYNGKPCLFIEAGKYHFYISRENSYKIITNVINPNVNPSGIIGQTYKNKIELAPKNYEVVGIWNKIIKL